MVNGNFTSLVTNRRNQRLLCEKKMLSISPVSSSWCVKCTMSGPGHSKEEETQQVEGRILETAICYKSSIEKRGNFH